MSFSLNVSFRFETFRADRPGQREENDADGVGA
jgi:hypothetical protein